MTDKFREVCSQWSDMIVLLLFFMGGEVEKKGHEKVGRGGKVYRRKVRGE